MSQSGSILLRVRCGGAERRRPGRGAEAVALEIVVGAGMPAPIAFSGPGSSPWPSFCRFGDLNVLSLSPSTPISLSLELATVLLLPHASVLQALRAAQPRSPVCQADLRHLL